MTAAAPAVATSKTEADDAAGAHAPAVPGLYLPAFGGITVGSTADDTSGKRENESDRDYVERVARGSSEAYPRPFSMTRLSEEDERRFASHDVQVLRRSAQRRILDRPVLFVDGPMDLACTAYAVITRSNQASKHIDGELVTTWGRERLERARDLVSQLPRDLLLNTYEGYNRSKKTYSAARVMMEGMTDKFYDGKLREASNALRQEHRQLTNGHQTPPPWLFESLTALRGRLNRLSHIQALLGNRDELPLRLTSAGWNRSDRAHYDRSLRPSIAQRLGEERADLQCAIGAVVSLASSSLVSQDRTAPTNGHGYFNLAPGDKVSRILFMHELLRETAFTLNWRDTDHDTLIRTANGVTGIFSFASFDIVARAPLEVNDTLADINLTSLSALRDRPEVRWGDDTRFYFYDGVEMDPERVTAATEEPASILTVRNAEQRRALLRLVGNDRLLKAVDATEVNEDDFGRLFVLPNGSQFVIVRNATPEPDGSVREYVLGTVGNKHRTARSGVASTWGLQEHQYWPVRET